MADRKPRKSLNLEGFDSIFGDVSLDTPERKIEEVNINLLYPFRNHPFKVADDDSMAELKESIRENGVLSPILVRPRKEGGYEIVSGHRRHFACKALNMETVPVLVQDLTDDQATIIMVDANLQREHIMISEKAFAYKMKYDALKHQGKRSTSAQFEQKSTAEQLSEHSDDSSQQIRRFIKLTDLNKALLDLTDEKKIPFNAAWELAFLPKESQDILEKFILDHEVFPTLNQSKQLHSLAKDDLVFTENILSTILLGGKTKIGSVRISYNKLKDYFPEDYTEKQIIASILTMLKSNAEKEQ